MSINQMAWGSRATSTTMETASLAWCRYIVGVVAGGKGKTWWGAGVTTRNFN